MAHVFDQRQEGQRPDNRTEPSDHVVFGWKRSRRWPDPVEYVTRYCLSHCAPSSFKSLSKLSQRAVSKNNEFDAASINDKRFLRGTDITINNTESLEAHKRQTTSSELDRASL